MCSTAGRLAFTLQPANGLAGDWDPRAGGTMYFGMSLAWVTDPDPADGVSLWALTNTASLDTGHPNPRWPSREWPRRTTS
jgi:hypothetical protein